jgi:hypothetical protein
MQTFGCKTKFRRKIKLPSPELNCGAHGSRKGLENGWYNCVYRVERYSFEPTTKTPQFFWTINKAEGVD